uniref:(northern house mosquito) hypothetical protein n=1 Tax=Culex pipiens TaxID=7175 RepID=A0A8D8FDV5_CULPI
MHESTLPIPTTRSAQTHTELSHYYLTRRASPARHSTESRRLHTTPSMHQYSRTRAAGLFHSTPTSSPSCASPLVRNSTLIIQMVINGFSQIPRTNSDTPSHFYGIT